MSSKTVPNKSQSRKTTMYQKSSNPDNYQNSEASQLLSAGSLKWFVFSEAAEDAARRNNLVEAEQFWWLALRSAELQQGSEGEGVILALDSLGEHYRKLELFTESMHLSLQSLQLKIKIYGKTHAIVALAMARLVPLYVARGKLSGAQVMRKRSRQILCKVQTTGKARIINIAKDVPQTQIRTVARAL